MKKITPYQTVEEALETLDNGGRFYNLFTKANDGNISTAELAKVAGVFNDSQQMTLFLEMSISKFSETEKQTILDTLSDNLLEKYQVNKSKLSDLTSVKSAKPSSSFLISGTLQFVKAKEEFTGFIMVPMSSGGMIMIPIIEEYDVYELVEEEGKGLYLAHTKGKETLNAKTVRLGGVVKEMKMDESKESKFLEIQYYMD